MNNLHVVKPIMKSNQTLPSPPQHQAGSASDNGHGRADPEGSLPAPDAFAHADTFIFGLRRRDKSVEIRESGCTNERRVGQDAKVSPEV